MIRTEELVKKLEEFNKLDYIQGQKIQYDVMKRPFVKCPVCGTMEYLDYNKYQMLTCPTCETRLRVTRFMNHVKFYFTKKKHTYIPAFGFKVTKGGKEIIDTSTNELIMTYKEYAALPAGYLREVIEENAMLEAQPSGE